MRAPPLWSSGDQGSPAVLSRRQQYDTPSLGLPFQRPEYLCRALEAPDEREPHRHPFAPRESWLADTTSVIPLRPYGLFPVTPMRNVTFRELTIRVSCETLPIQDSRPFLLFLVSTT
jgi:hypothetical protein